MTLKSHPLWDCSLFLLSFWFYYLNWFVETLCILKELIFCDMSHKYLLQIYSLTFDFVYTALEIIKEETLI